MVAGADDAARVCAALHRQRGSCFGTDGQGDASINTSSVNTSNNNRNNSINTKKDDNNRKSNSMHRPSRAQV